jgi:hypothetical protein
MRFFKTDLRRCFRTSVAMTEANYCARQQLNSDNPGHREVFEKLAKNFNYIMVGGVGFKPGPT